MAKAEASVEELVGMIERGELRLPEMQRQYVQRSTPVRDLLDSLYRGYPSGPILLCETLEKWQLHQDHETLGVGRGIASEQESQKAPPLVPPPCSGAFHKHKCGMNTEPRG
jgi:hypothetical protein